MKRNIELLVKGLTIATSFILGCFLMGEGDFKIGCLYILIAVILGNQLEKEIYK
jgi:hypothetical protein